MDDNSNVHRNEVEEDPEIRQIIEEATRIRNLPQRWPTPAQLRKAAETWVDGRNRISESSRRLREESGILVSSKWECVAPDHLKEPLYSEVLKVMVERGEWETEPGTDIPKYKITPTIRYAARVTNRGYELITDGRKDGTLPSSQ